MGNTTDTLVSNFAKDPKGALTMALIIAIIGIVIWLLWYKSSKAIKGLMGDIETATEGKANINAVERRTGTTATYTDYEYKQFADQLYTAMNGWTTDEDSVRTRMEQMKSESDLARLENAFGKRDSSWNPFDDPTGLSAWLHDDFRTAEEMEEWVNAPLRANGIKKQY